jgi:VWFA-related protein
MLFGFAAIMLAQQEQPEATFRAGTKLVEVDVVAQRNGAPAIGLSKDDFTLLDNGKKQIIAFFSVRSRKTGGNATVPPPPGVFSNRVWRGADAANTTVILLDQMNTPQTLQAYAIARIAKFIQSQHGRDRIGIYTILGNGGLYVVEELTSNSELLTRAANSLKARDPRRRDSDTTGMTRHESEGYAAIGITGPALGVTGALVQIARHLANVPGRKNVVWITTAFPVYDLGLGIDFRPEMEKAARALNDANAALYAVDARGLMGALDGLTAISDADVEKPGPPRSPRLIAMTMQRGEPANPRGLYTEQMLSGLTGGLTFFNKSNALEESIQTAVDDGNLTYTLGFYPQESEQDRTWHDLKVAVRRPGVSLRYRRSYLARPEGEATDGRPTLEQLLKEPLDATQLELRVSVARNTPQVEVLQVKVNVDLHNVAFKHENMRRLGAVDLAFHVEGTGGMTSKTVQVDIPDDQFATFLEKGLNMVASVDTRGGVEAFRVLVQDRATGAAGSVTVPLPNR